MPAQKSAKPATEMVSGLRKSEQLGGELRFQANPQRLSIQAVDISAPLEFALNGREVIRAEISAFNGWQIFNVRRWYRAEDGSIWPTKKGLACAIRHLPALAALLADTLERARTSGLLPNDGTRP
jgi:Transcriptional Coactivator p15 (PC4)